MNRLNRFSLGTRLNIYIMACLAVVFIIISIVIGMATSKTSEKNSLKYASEVTRSIALDLDKTISEHYTMAKTLASILNSNVITTRPAVVKMLIDLYGKSDWVVATYAGYEPDGFDGNDRPWKGKPVHNPAGQFLPFVHTHPKYGMIHDASKIIVDSLLNIETYDFYQGPKKANAPYITPPWVYLDPNTNVLQKIVCLTAPLQWPNGSFRGMAGVNINTGALLDKFNSLQVFPNGFVFIIHKDGLLLTFPDQKLTFEKKLSDIRDRFGNADLERLVSDIAGNRGGYIQGDHPVTGDASWLVYAPVPTTQWGVVVVAPKRDVFADKNRLLATTSILMALSGIGIFLLIILLTRRIVTPVDRVIRGVADSADSIDFESRNIMDKSCALSEGTATSASSIEEVSASITEMAAQSRHSSKSARDCNEMMKEVARNITSIQSRLDSVTQSVVDIQTSAEETKKIVKTTDDIAFQTNLLALNAAVEAARAGESGAGFAVVADEVRNLAQRAANASKNAAELVDRIVANIKTNATHTMETREHIFRNNDLVLKVADLLDEIAVASDEHQAGITQVEVAVNQISKVTQDTSGKAAEITASTTRLNAQAENLNLYMEDLQTLVLGNARESVSTGEDGDDEYMEPPSRGEYVTDDRFNQLKTGYRGAREPYALPPKKKR